MLADLWDPELSLLEWRTRLVDAGYRWDDAAVLRELRAIGAPGFPDGVGMTLAVPTMLEHASAQLQDRLVRATVVGEITWTQLFSEPGAGSDLAGLSTRADRDGDVFRVNGQKVWNTSAHHADYGLLLARTDWDAPKHRGITCFAVPMHQAGVEVRPLRQMNGHASFNEVYFSDAFVDAANVIGELNGGWAVARTTLAYERKLAQHRSDGATTPPAGRAWAEAIEETARNSRPYTWYPQRGGRADLLFSQQTDDPVTRQEIARTLSMARAAQWTAARAAAARVAGKPPGAEGSIGKLASSDIARQAARTHTLTAGAAAMTNADPIVAEVLISVPAISIAGGTDEVQHNIVGERILDLPREPDDSRELPFRDVRRST
ncbi:MAG TPA: acyl-CoA dehydrogenase family protein [Acidimicrobiales bacterium]|nr:acyl-CoA dehydrogenase family protein [Acidimicrobiales bacterium]